MSIPFFARNLFLSAFNLWLKGTKTCLKDSPFKLAASPICYSKFELKEQHVYPKLTIPEHWLLFYQLWAALCQPEFVFWLYKGIYIATAV